MFRPNLNRISSESELREYFEKNAGYNVSAQTYCVAGIYSDDTRTLYEKLESTWKEEREKKWKNETLMQTLSKT